MKTLKYAKDDYVSYENFYYPFLYHNLKLTIAPLSKVLVCENKSCN